MSRGGRKKRDHAKPAVQIPLSPVRSFSGRSGHDSTGKSFFDCIDPERTSAGRIPKTVKFLFTVA
jgi:hypothetical protein